MLNNHTSYSQHNQWAWDRWECFGACGTYLRFRQPERIRRNVMLANLSATDLMILSVCAPARAGHVLQAHLDTWTTGLQNYRVDSAQLSGSKSIYTVSYESSAS